MSDMISKEIIESLERVGELVKADPRYKAMEAATEKYNKCEEISNAINEYSVQQNLLSVEYAKENSDNATMDAIQHRIDELYSFVTEHPVYAEYKDVADEFESFTEAVFEELQYQVTGHRGCSHDCSSCGGCH
jgi:cell fate (sporulation/competence/biofilm development) regulator YmcA (YheA/YmcA/DUF963 family)